MDADVEGKAQDLVGLGKSIQDALQTIFRMCCNGIVINEHEFP